MADNPVPELGNKTPLEYANIPTIDAMCAKGVLGSVSNCPAGLPAGSDTAITSIFGCDPRKYYTGRAPLEAAASGIKLKTGDIAYRCNMVAYEDDDTKAFEEKKILSHSAGSIEAEDSDAIVTALFADPEFAAAAAKAGMKVTLLEKNLQPGGCLQTFTRLGRKFDTGFHYVGGLGEGESLYPVARYLGLLDLPWKQLSADCADKVVIGDEEFCIATGHDNFAGVLSERFPGQKDNLKKYVSFLKSVGDNIYRPIKEEDAVISDLFSTSAYDFLKKTITDPLLRKVLSGTSLKMHLDAGSLPLYVFAQINNSFIQSSWRLQGGGEMVVSHLVDAIESMGGEVRSGAEVTALKERDGRIVGVEIGGEDVLEADWIISGTHPSITMGLLDDSSSIRRVYRRRMTSLKNSYGMFTANVCLKKEHVKYQQNNIFVHTKDADLWNPDLFGTESAMVHFYVPDSGDYADRLDIMSPMDFSLVEQWQSLPVGRRGKVYESIKRAKAEACVDLVSRYVPGLEDGIEAVFTSTPLTYQDYTGSPFGSAYGVVKDCHSPLTTVISPRTPISNLLLTGQSLNLHGFLGVSMTSLLTCSSILGMDYIRKELGI